jgi:hypothetical protein
LIIIGLAIAAVYQLPYRAHAPSASTTFEKIVLKQTARRRSERLARDRAQQP